MSEECVTRRHRGYIRWHVIGVFLISVMVLVSENVAGQDVDSAATDVLVTGCERLVSEFEDGLKSGLTSALKEGGAGYAVGVCEITAPAMAARFSRLEGWSIRRTALRVRNPLNAADAFERGGLDRLVSDTAAFYHTWTRDTTGQRRFRYLAAIYHQPRCAGCHGDPTQFSGAVRAALAELYPLDQATGFKLGELRGAYSVTVEWPQGQAVADSLRQAARGDGEAQGGTD